MEEIITIAQHNGGLVTAQQVAAAGIPGARLSDLVRLGRLERVHRGVYCLVDAWEDEFLSASLRFPRGVFSHLTALYLHSYTDRIPFHLEMTFPRTYNATAVRTAGMEVHTCANNVLTLGLCEVATPCGNVVRSYDVERTLCDMMRGQKVFDEQVVNPAMRAYVSAKSRNLPLLMEYAQALGVEKKMQSYLRVLL